MPKQRNFLKSAGIISLFTFVSRVLGLVRDHLCARLFGAGLVWDAFVIAFTIPNLFRRLFGEGALSAAFIPVFSRYLEKENRREAWDMISAVATALALLLTIVVVIGIALASVLPGLGSLESRLLMLMFPYTFLICMAALLMAILNTLGRFTLPALSQVVLNACWIGGVFLLVPLMGGEQKEQIFGIAIAILIGGVIQLFMQAPQVFRAGIAIRPYFNLRHPGLREVARHMFPIVVGLAPTQLNIVADRFIAKAMAPPGSNSVLFFSNRLMQFPLALIGIAMATAVFPLFSRYSAMNMVVALRDTFRSALRVTLFLAIPASIGLVVLREPIVRLLFDYGKFADDPEAARQTATCLLYYAAGIWAFCLHQIVTRAFYATGNTRIPVLVSLGAVVVNLVVNLLLVKPLGAAGLALATSATATLQVLVLIRLMERKVGTAFDERLILSIFRSLILSAGMGLAAYGLTIGIGLSDLPTVVYDMTSNLLSPSYALMASRLPAVVLPMIAAIVLYLLGAKLLKMPELSEITFRKKEEGEDADEND